ncbi:hypothetical protein ACWEWI_28380 [Streptomyces sp. NPDC003753]
MSRESRTPFSLGPLARERYRKAGKLASLALVMAVGPATPAAAVGSGGTVRPIDNCDVIDATPAERDAVVYVSVLTANGQVQEGTCTTSGGNPGPRRPINVPCTFVTDFPTPPAS